jgi:hypothetical protein
MMSDFVKESISPASTNDSSANLFMWRGSGIVLLGERVDDRWVLARGWLGGDRLEHVRRWSFSQPIPFSGQVRRLVMEACGDFAHARDEGLRALGWAESGLKAADPARPVDSPR